MEQAPKSVKISIPKFWRYSYRNYSLIFSVSYYVINLLIYVLIVFELNNGIKIRIKFRIRCNF